jgi:ribose 5-phosphate isomerase B
MTIYLTSDHGGFALKAVLVEHLAESEYKVVDLGPKTHNPHDDYVDFAVAGVKKLLAHKPEHNRLIMACRTGEGEVIVANRFPGIRAVVVWDTLGAMLSRDKNNANVLCLAGDLVDKDTNLKIVDIWLATPFSNAERHLRRLKKIDQLTPHKI